MSFRTIESQVRNTYFINDIEVKAYRIPLGKFKLAMRANSYQEFINSIEIEDLDNRYDHSYWIMVNQWVNHNNGDITISCVEGWVYFE